MSRRARSLLLLAVKLAVAAGLLVYLVGYRRALTWDSFRPVRDHWERLPACFALLGCIPLVGALRWRMFLRGQGFEVSYRRALHLTLVGLFFNCVGVGYTGGDVAKAYYAAGDQPRGRRAEAVTTVFFDRAVGLLGLVTLGLLAMALRPAFIWRDPRLRVAAVLMLGLAGAAVAAFLLTFFEKLRGAGGLFDRLGRLPGGAMLLRVYRAVMVYRSRPGVILAAVGLSLVAHSLNIAFLWQLSRALAAPPISPAEFAFAIAIGLAASSFGPPLGVGFGQGAFDFMLQPLGVPIGAALATLMQAMNLIFCIAAGLPAFLLVRKEAARVQAEMAEDQAADDAGPPAPGAPNPAGEARG